MELRSTSKANQSLVYLICFAVALIEAPCEKPATAVTLTVMIPGITVHSLLQFLMGPDSDLTHHLRPQGFFNPLSSLDQRKVLSQL